MIATQWPRANTIAAAIRGTAAGVIPTPIGPVRGVRSAYPWIVFAVAPVSGEPFPSGPHAACFRCDKGEAVPPPPTSQGLNGAGMPLFPLDSVQGALFVLSWLNAFARKHDECKEQKEEVSE